MEEIVALWIVQKTEQYLVYFSYFPLASCREFHIQTVLQKISQVEKFESWLFSPNVGEQATIAHGEYGYGKHTTNLL